MTDDDLEQFIKGQIDQIKTNPNPSQVHEEIQATDVSDEENKAEPIDHETIINNLIGNLRKAQDKARNEPEVEDEIDRLLSGRSRIEKQPEAYQSVLEQTTIVNTTTDTKTSSNDSTQIIQVDTPESVVQHQDIFDFSHKGIHTNDEPFIHEELEQEPTSDTQANIQEPTKYAETSLAPDIASFIDEFNNDFTIVTETIQVETPESVTQHEDIFDVTLEGIDLDEEPFIHDAFEHDELGQTEAYTQVDESAEYPMLDSANVSVQLVDFESHTISGALTQDQAAIDNMADESLEMETENTSEFENRVEASNDELFEMLGSDESDDFTSEQEPNDFPNTEISTNELDNSNVS